MKQYVLSVHSGCSRSADVGSWAFVWQPQAVTLWGSTKTAEGQDCEAGWGTAGHSRARPTVIVEYILHTLQALPVSLAAIS
jgi:hypothetical protein